MPWRIFSQASFLWAGAANFCPDGTRTSNTDALPLGSSPVWRKRIPSGPIFIDSSEGLTRIVPCCGNRGNTDWPYFLSIAFSAMTVSSSRPSVWWPVANRTISSHRSCGSGLGGSSSEVKGISGTVEETRAGSNPALGTITITKGNPASPRVIFSNSGRGLTGWHRESGPF